MEPPWQHGLGFKDRHPGNPLCNGPALSIQLPGTQQFFNVFQHLRYRHPRRVDHYGVGRGNQWRHCSLAVALVASTDFHKQVVEVNTCAFPAQLAIAALRPGLGARVKENLQGRIGEHHRAHVATVGNQAWRGTKIALPLQECCPYHRRRRDLRREIAGSLGTDFVGPVGTPDQDCLVSLGFTDELDLQIARQRRHSLMSIQRNAGVHGGEREDAIQRTAVEPMPAGPGRQPTRNHTLADTARAINRNYQWQGGSHDGCCSLTCSPALLIRLTKPGNEVLTLAQSRMVIAPVARRPAIAKLMAMR